MPLISTKSLTLALGVSFCGVSGYLLYQFFKNDEDDEYPTSTSVTATSNYKIAEMKVPNDVVRLIIGRNGQKIQQLQEETGTRISFREPLRGVNERVCVIRGSLEDCFLAQNLISQIIYTEPVLDCDTIWVPQQAVGKIIGRCGENIQAIIHRTGAQIQVSDRERMGLQRKITIKGTSAQIALAASYIDEIVETYTNIGVALAKREPRAPAKCSSTGEAAKMLESPKVEKMTTIPGQSDSPFEVYISAMIDPSRFWVQIVGPKAKELDLLVEEMTEYYRNSENVESHKLDGVAIGDLVAATFQYDNKWYRAEILNLAENNQAELYYVDYGDTDTVSTADLYELRTDFLRLHFQAIECFLARIEPSGDSWSEEAVDKFEEWTHVAQWQKLSAKVNEYCVREKTRAKREGSPVPGVDLFDVANDSDIAQELVRQGYAIYKKEATRSSSRATSMSNVSNISNASHVSNEST